MVTPQNVKSALTQLTQKGMVQTRTFANGSQIIIPGPTALDIRECSFYARLVYKVERVDLPKPVCYVRLKEQITTGDFNLRWRHKWASPALERKIGEIHSNCFYDLYEQIRRLTLKRYASPQWRALHISSGGKSDTVFLLDKNLTAHERLAVAQSLELDDEQFELLFGEPNP